jgi:hypothetical protein
MQKYTIKTDLGSKQYDILHWCKTVADENRAISLAILASKTRNYSNQVYFVILPFTTLIYKGSEVLYKLPAYLIFNSTGS